MTIEINELVIKATVVPPAVPPLSVEALEQLKKTLHDECVNTVLERIQQADQR